ncbi:MAG: hypothetical protein ACLU9T_04155 [Blautia faecis]
MLTESSLAMGNSLEILGRRAPPVEWTDPDFYTEGIVEIAAILEQQGLKCLVQLAKLQKLSMTNMEFQT